MTEIIIRHSAKIAIPFTLGAYGGFDFWWVVIVLLFAELYALKKHGDKLRGDL